MNLKKSVILVCGMILFSAVETHAFFGGKLGEWIKFNQRNEELKDQSKKNNKRETTAQLQEELDAKRKLAEAKAAAENLKLQRLIAEQRKKNEELARSNNNSRIPASSSRPQFIVKQVEADPAKSGYTKPHIRHGLRRKIASN
jgi:flagellar biosynthesis GTPase FlhF